MLRRSFLKGSVSTVPLVFAFRGGVGTGVAVTTITSITLSNASFSGGAPSGTTIGTISVQTTGGPFTGSLSLSGADAASFQIVGDQLQTSGVVAAGSYSINIVATQGGALGSPFTQPKTITGISSGSHQVATVTIVNDSAGTFTAGSYIAKFCWPGKKGDFAAGTVPIFKSSGGVVQPFTPGMIAQRDYSGSDNSVQNASYFVRPTFNIAAGASADIQVWTDGAVPSASGRTIAELLAEKIQINITGAGSSFGLTGNWVCQFFDTNNATFAKETWADGSAGLMARVEAQFYPADGSFSPTSSTPHGQLRGELYAYILNDAAGNLGGFYVLPCLMQPNYNVDSPSKAPRSMSLVQWQHGASPTTVGLTWPWTTAYDFTTAGGTANASTTVANNLYQGSFGDVTLVPCVLSTTGTLPAPLSAATLYWVKGHLSSNTQIQFCSKPMGGNITLTTAGTGTHTLTPVPTLLHFGRMFMPTSDAHYNYFQGAGSIAAFGEARMKVDQGYWIDSGIIPHYDLSLVSSEVANATYNYGWHPYTIGPLTSVRSGTGSRPDIGPLNGYNVKSFYKQLKNDDLIDRLIGYAGTNDLKCFRDGTTQRLPNLTAANFTGFPAPSTGQQAIDWFPDVPGGGGFTLPPSANTECQFDQGTNAHRSLFWYWAYLKTGEPQYLRMGQELANGGIIDLFPDWRNPTTPTSRKGVMMYWMGASALRRCAWGWRDVVLASVVSPNTDPTGSDNRGYFGSVSDNTSASMVDVFNNDSAPWYQSVGLWLPHAPAGSVLVSGTPFSATGAFMMATGFQYRYGMTVAIFAAQMRENADAITILTNYAKFLAHIAGNLGYWFLYSDFVRSIVVDNISEGNIGYPPIAADSDFAVEGTFNSVSWNGAGGTGNTWSAPLKYTGFVMRDGDWFNFLSGNTTPCPSNYIADTQKYYVINSSKAGTTCHFDLTTVAGSSADIVVPTGTGTVVGKVQDCFYAPSVDVPAAVGAVYGNATGTDSDQGTIRYCSNMMQHIGIAAPVGGPTLAQISADALARMNPTGSNGYQVTPMWAASVL